MRSVEEAGPYAQHTIVGALWDAQRVIREDDNLVAFAFRIAVLLNLLLKVRLQLLRPAGLS
jgi:hypothetical protein